MLTHWGMDFWRKWNPKDFLAQEIEVGLASAAKLG